MEGTIRILVIEDDLIIAENLKENLQELGYEQIDSAWDWTSVQRLVDKNNYDLVIADIKLNGSKKNGIEVVEVLYERQRFATIYLTAFDDVRTRDQAKKTHPSGYLIKPASKRQLDVAIDFAMDKMAPRETRLGDKKQTRCPFIKSNGYYYIKHKSRYQKIRIDDVVYLNANGSSCSIVMNDHQMMVSTSLQSVLEQIQDEDIVRCHRSWAVHTEKIDCFDDHSVYVRVGSHVEEIPIGATFKEALQGYLPKILSS